MAENPETTPEVPMPPEEVLSLLEEQVRLYEQLEALAGRQRPLITVDNPEPLLALLAGRQRLTTRITRLALQLEPVRAQWARYQGRMTVAQRERADQMLRTVQERLSKVMAGDEQDAKLLAARKQAAAGVLRRTHASRQALAAYQTPVRETGRLNQVHEES